MPGRLAQLADAMRPEQRAGNPAAGTNPRRDSENAPPSPDTVTALRDSARLPNLVNRAANPGFGVNRERDQRSSSHDRPESRPTSSRQGSAEQNRFGLKNRAQNPAGSNDKEKRKSLINLASPDRRSSVDLSFLKIGDKDKKKEKEKDKEKGEKVSTPREPVCMMPPKDVQLIINVESPPLILYGPPTSSTGALFSAKVNMNVSAAHVSLNKFQGELVSYFKVRKPIVEKCTECAVQKHILHSWPLIRGKPLELDKGEHNVPFSFLLPGTLPATTNGLLGCLSYAVEFTATSTNGDTFNVSHELVVSRAINPANDKHSTRKFPPLSIVAETTFCPVIHPIGAFPVPLRMTNLKFDRLSTNEPIYKRWKLMRVMWRIEETETIISPVCPKHIMRASETGKRIQREETRTIGSGELKDGWKTDYNSPNASIDVELTPAINAALRPRVCCDVQSPNGLDIKHVLIIEFIVAEMIVTLQHGGLASVLARNKEKSKEAKEAKQQKAPNGEGGSSSSPSTSTPTSPATTNRPPLKLKNSSKEPPRTDPFKNPHMREVVQPTGSARHLQAKFAVVVTERAGLGISWDEEQPPVYEDVPPSPPLYAHVGDYVGSPLFESVPPLPLPPPFTETPDGTPASPTAVAAASSSGTTTTAAGAVPHRSHSEGAGEGTTRPMRFTADDFAEDYRPRVDREPDESENAGDGTGVDEDEENPVDVAVS